MGREAALTIADRILNPETGRSKKTAGEIGLGGHWVNPMLHYMIPWKARHRPFWFLIRSKREERKRDER